jgi:predicted Rossmann fold flavoprotein
LSSEITKITSTKNGFNVFVGKDQQYSTTKILVAAGGYNNLQSYNWIAETSHPIINPIPSLFTFNDSEKKFHDLMGIAVAHAEVKIAGTKFSEYGPVLITHWGLSGPAIIKLSAWAADYLHRLHYQFTVLVNWTGNTTEEALRQLFYDMKNKHGKQKVLTNPMFFIPQRLWQRLCELAEIPEAKIWVELPQKNLNKLMESLIRCPFQIKGKTTFKEEFVTCGGVDLKSINIETMESKTMQGLYFAGEILNIDGETGGFNFQSAWTTAWVAAQHIASQ